LKFHPFKKNKNLNGNNVMHFSERDFPKKFNKKISSNTDEQILVTVTQSVTNVPQTNNTSGMNEE
jgi:hypothetical protein